MSPQDPVERKNTLHPSLVEALEARPFPDLTAGDSNASLITIRKHRADHLAALRHLYPIPGPIPDSVKETQIQIPARDGFSIPARLYHPIYESALPPAERPVIVMLHEGGWSMGDLSDEDQNCRLFCRDLSAVSVNVDYRLAPEHAFPAGVNDCWDAVSWVAKTASPNSEVLPADPKKGLVVGGASAGGNLAAIVSQLSRNTGLQPPVTGQYLCAAALLDSVAVPERWRAELHSREISVSDPVLSTKGGNAKLQVALKMDPFSTLFSPLLCDDLKGLPPAYFQIGELDPLFDESVLYERLLSEAAVKTRLEAYEGYGHMFWTNWPELPQSKDFVSDTAKGMRWLLQAGSNR